VLSIGPPWEGDTFVGSGLRLAPHDHVTIDGGTPRAGTLGAALPRHWRVGIGWLTRAGMKTFFGIRQIS